MLELNRSLLNREYILMNVLKALALIISIFNLHVILLSKITPRHFTLQVKVKATLRPTISRTVRLDVRRPSGTRDQFFHLLEIFLKTVTVC
jgi:hypothetical protein